MLFKLCSQSGLLSELETIRKQYLVHKQERVALRVIFEKKIKRFLDNATSLLPQTGLGGNSQLAHELLQLQRLVEASADALRRSDDAADTETKSVGPSPYTDTEQAVPPNSGQSSVYDSQVAIVRPPRPFQQQSQEFSSVGYQPQQLLNPYSSRSLTQSSINPHPAVLEGSSYGDWKQQNSALPHSFRL